VQFFKTSEKTGNLMKF